MRPALGFLAQHQHERVDGAREGDEDGERRNPAGVAARDARASERDRERPDQRGGQADPCASRRHLAVQLRHRVDVEREPPPRHRDDQAEADAHL